MLIEDWETVEELFPESSASAAGQLLWDSASIEQLGQVFAICLLHPNPTQPNPACLVPCPLWLKLFNTARPYNILTSCPVYKIEVDDMGVLFLLVKVSVLVSVQRQGVSPL